MIPKRRRKVVRIAPKLKRQGITIKGVRLDSGDLAEHAFKVRRILDEGGLGHVTIFASGSVAEYVLEEPMTKNAPIDGFDIGTHMDTSADAPYLDCAYKLVEYAGRPRRKRSEGKVLWPGRKQVYRRYTDHSRVAEDILTLEDDAQPYEPLMALVMKTGKRVKPTELLQVIRARSLDQIRRLPRNLLSLDAAACVSGDHRRLPTTCGASS
jgi:nicotinate phosphoribosyltransferase